LCISLRKTGLDHLPRAELSVQTEPLPFKFSIRHVTLPPSANSDHRHLHACMAFLPASAPSSSFQIPSPHKHHAETILSHPLLFALQRWQNPRSRRLPLRNATAKPAGGPRRLRNAPSGLRLRESPSARHPNPRPPHKERSFLLPKRVRRIQANHSLRQMRRIRRGNDPLPRFANPERLLLGRHYRVAHANGPLPRSAFELHRNAKPGVLTRQLCCPQCFEGLRGSSVGWIW